jgi:hypothetical protein
MRRAVSTVAAVLLPFSAACSTSREQVAAEPTTGTESIDDAEQALDEEAEIVADKEADDVAELHDEADPDPSETEATAPGCTSTIEPPGNPSDDLDLDVDGDGTIDEVRLFNVDDTWMVVVGFGSGGGVTAEVRGANGLDTARILGGADLDGDGVDELALRVGGGAYTEQVAFLRARACEIVELTFADGSPAVFLVGGSYGGGEALVCPGNGTVERFSYWLLAGAADADDANQPRYEGEFVPYRLDGEVLVEQPGSGAPLTSDDVADLLLLDCQGLVL